MAPHPQHIVIRGTGVISPLGHDGALVAAAYKAGKPGFSTMRHLEQDMPVAALPAAAEEALQQLVQANPDYRQLDRSVLMAVYAAKQAATEAGWLTQSSDAATHDDLAVNIGSSRGATGLFEQHFSAYQRSHTLSPSASPTTTLGNLSSWVAHAVQAGGAQLSHSITCSTALMAIANAVAWLRAGMAQRFLAGGTEAPLTPFTLAQMKAVGIYSKLPGLPYPCQPYTLKQNTFALGEGAAVFALELVPEAQLRPGDFVIEAVGLGMEKLVSKTGITPDGQNFQKSMRHALSQLPENDRTIDLLLTHTPGTRSGDKAELAAIQAVFADRVPGFTNNKWLVGHTLGASGALSLQYALHILQCQHVAPLPYIPAIAPAAHANYSRIMVNAAGFGGNAASIIIRSI